MPSIDGESAANTVDLVLLAAPRSFCAGVEMAIKALARMVRLFGPPVYCYHEIVHNQVVVEQFRRAGVVFVDDVTDVPPGAPLMLSAHGSAPQVIRDARARSRVVVDAVCPLVKKVHHEVQQRSDKGHAVVYAGHPGHDEAIGTLAVSPHTTHLVERPGDVAALDAVDGPVAFLAQTTLAVDEWQEVLAATRDRFGDVWLPGRSDLCFATTNRQAAVRAIAPRCDAVVVIGSANSSNTVALTKVARSCTPDTRVVRVNGPEELPADLRGTVGVTAGASAPENVVQGVVAQLAPRNGVEVVDVTPEDEYFPPPRELRELLGSIGADTVLERDRAVAASDVLRELGEPEPAPIVAPAAAAAPATTPATSTTAATAAKTPPAPTAAAIVAEALDAHTARIDRQMAEVVEQEVVDPWLRDAISYHLGWLDERFEPLPAGAPRPGGKKLRATLAVLAYQAAATAAGHDPDDVDRVVPFAAAVELTHNWSLVHDDIEDGDRTRRGRPALWALCGAPQAINAGDCVFALTFRCLDRLRDRGAGEARVAQLLSELARTTVELTVGQMRDLAFESNPDVGGQRYLEMIEGKTGALLRCATYGGALIGSGDPRDARALGEFGRRLGLSFQIRDDVLGIWGADEETGKPTGSDIRRRKKSLPVVLALEHADAPVRDRLRRIYTDDSPMSAGDERYVREALDGCAAQQLAQEQARRHRAAAVAALALAAGTAGRPLSRPPFSTLRALADFVTERTH